MSSVFSVYEVWLLLLSDFFFLGFFFFFLVCCLMYTGCISFVIGFVLLFFRFFWCVLCFMLLFSLGYIFFDFATPPTPQPHLFTRFFGLLFFFFFFFFVCCFVYFSCFFFCSLPTRQTPTKRPGPTASLRQAPNTRQPYRIFFDFLVCLVLFFFR